MAYTNAFQQYHENSVLTASKGKLLLMTYDGATRFISQAKAHMAALAYEEQNTCIIKAQRLLLELIYTLNPSADRDLAQRLTQLYEYMFNRLVEANVNDDAAALDEVLWHLGELRAAWAQADREVSGGQTATPRINAPGGDRYAVAA